MLWYITVCDVGGDCAYAVMFQHQLLAFVAVSCRVAWQSNHTTGEEATHEGAMLCQKVPAKPKL